MGCLVKKMSGKIQPRHVRIKTGTSMDYKRNTYSPPKHKGILVRKFCDIDWGGEKQIRGGVIPYFGNSITDPKFMVCMGMDSVYGSLTDFGGGIKAKDKNVLDGALRELEEESLNSINRCNLDISTSFVVSSNTMLILFARCTSKEDKIVSDFRGSMMHSAKPEISNMFFMSVNEFIFNTGPHSNTTYIPVRDLISPVIEEILSNFQ